MVKYMLEDTYKIKSEIICIDADICKDFDAVVAMSLMTVQLVPCRLYTVG